MLLIEVSKLIGEGEYGSVRINTKRMYLEAKRQCKQKIEKH